MARIHVLGGTGHGGAAVVREAVRRGHTVTAYSRNLPTEPVEGATYVQGSLVDPDFLAASVLDADVVFEALSPRGDMADRLADVREHLIKLADLTGVRLGVLGGASSVRVTEDGPRLFDVHEVPAEVLPEVEAGLALLEALQNAPASLDWFYVSPAQEFGSWFPEIVTGEYRINDGVLLTDESGRSYISAADLALAVLDEIEQPLYVRKRFHVAH